MWCTTPELRFTQGAAGSPVPGGVNPRFYDKQSGQWKGGETLFLTCQAWKQAAENAAESLNRGTRVIVTGRLRQRSYETREARSAPSTSWRRTSSGVSLRNATAKVTRASRTSSGGGTRTGGQREADPWASGGPGGASDGPPF